MALVAFNAFDNWPQSWSTWIATILFSTHNMIGGLVISIEWHFDIIEDK